MRPDRAARFPVDGLHAVTGTGRWIRPTYPNPPRSEIGSAGAATTAIGAAQPHPRARRPAVPFGAASRRSPGPNAARARSACAAIAGPARPSGSRRIPASGDGAGTPHEAAALPMSGESTAFIPTT